MREIKFRVWNIQDKRWDNPSILEVWNDSGKLEPYSFVKTGKLNPLYIPIKNYVIQQFTGLLDKNGREIYEGDIVIHENPYSTSVTKEQGEIIFDKGAFWLRNESGDWYFDTSPIVIGNIFENPELCKIEK